MPFCLACVIDLLDGVSIMQAEGRAQTTVPKGGAAGRSHAVRRSRKNDLLGERDRRQGEVARRIRPGYTQRAYAHVFAYEKDGALGEGMGRGRNRAGRQNKREGCRSASPRHASHADDARALPGVGRASRRVPLSGFPVPACAAYADAVARSRGMRVLLAALLLAAMVPGLALLSPVPAHAASYVTGKTESYTEYRLYVNKGNGNGDEWNISLDSFLKVTDGSETHDVWCVDITRLYPKGKTTNPVDALQVMPQEQLTKIALAHDYAFGSADGGYAHFPGASWAQRYSIVQAYTWWVMQHVPGTGMENYTIYSVEVLSGEGGWGSRWSSAWAELNAYVDANAALYKGSGTAFVSDEAQTVAAWFSVERLTGSVALDKVSSNPELTDGNGCYSLAGAVYGVYSDAACTKEVARMTTDANGHAQADAVPLGTYWVQEISAPAGFAVDVTVYPVKVLADETTKVNGGPVKEAPLSATASLLVGKYDGEKAYSGSDNLPQGAASLEGAQFAVRHYGGFYDDAATAEESGDPLRTWTVSTDRNGHAFLAEPDDAQGAGLPDNDWYCDGEGNPTLPLGTYLVQEIKAPKGYLVNSQVYVQQVVAGGDSGQVPVYHVPEVPDQVVRGDLSLVKVNEDTMARMAGVPFEIVSDATGERHVIVTDENGCASTSGDWNAHSYRTNANDDAEEGSYDAMAGVWFGDVAALDNGKGALPYDTYTVNELPCAANAGQVLVKDLSVTVSRDSHVIDLGTVDDKPVRISTTATDAELGGHEAWADEEVTIVDVVEYENATVGGRYTLAGILMDKGTGEPVAVDGLQVTAETAFSPEQPQGEVNVEFTFDGSALGTSDVVVFEALYRDVEGGQVLVAEHADLQSEGQTVKLQPREEPPEEGRPYDKTGVPLDSVFAGAGVLGAAACAAALYGALQWRRSRKAR